MTDGYSKNSRVSIVIPAYNSAVSLRETIKALLCQNYPGEKEIIVVDDGSTDATREVVKGFPQVQYFYQDNAGPATARNRGWKISTGEVVFFTDADCEPKETWIKTMLGYLAETKVAVVSGSYGIKNNDSLLARCIYREIIFRHRTLMPDYPKSFGSYNFCVRRNVMMEVGGFDETYRSASGEDNDLSYRIFKAGYAIRFAKKVEVNHVFPENLVLYLREQARHGFWRAKMYRDHPGMSRGDDYTFVKDMMEPVLVCVIAAGTAMWALGVTGGGITVLTGTVLLGITETAYSFRMCAFWTERLYLCAVMFLRSFTRTYGFIVGIWNLMLCHSSKKKSKKSSQSTRLC